MAAIAVTEVTEAIKMDQETKDTDQGINNQQEPSIAASAKQEYPNNKPEVPSLQTTGQAAPSMTQPKPRPNKKLILIISAIIFAVLIILFVWIGSTQAPEEGPNTTQTPDDTNPDPTQEPVQTPEPTPTPEEIDHSEEIPEKVLNFPQPVSVLDVAVDNQGNIYIADEEGKRVMRFDKDLEYEKNMVITPDTRAPHMVDIDEDVLYVLDRIEQKIIKIDQQTKEELRLPVYSRAFRVTSDRIYVADETNNDRILIFDKEMQKIGTIGPYSDPAQSIANPLDIDVDSKGNIYIADDSNNRIQIYDSEFQFSESITSASGKVFNSARGVRIGQDDRIYITDKNNDRVVILDSDKNLIKEITGLNKPYHCFIDSSGKLYVSDYGNNRLVIFDSTYNQIDEIEGKLVAEVLSFFDPRAIAFDSEDNVYIADDQNNRIIILDSSNQFIEELGGTQGSADDQFNRPRSLAFDSKDNLYAVDRFNNRVQVFDSDNNYIATIGTEEELSEPRGVAVDDTDRIYVADTLNNRVLVYDSGYNLIKTIDSSLGEDYALDRPRHMFYYKEKLYILMPQDKTIKVIGKDLDFIKDIDLSDIVDIPRSLAAYQDKLYLNDIAGPKTIEIDLNTELVEQKLLSRVKNLRNPRGIAINSKGLVYIADEGNNRVIVFDIEFNPISEIRGEDVGKENNIYSR